jgi:hypothetical protein
LGVQKIEQKRCQRHPNAHDGLTHHRQCGELANTDMDCENSGNQNNSFGPDILSPKVPNHPN